MSVDSWLRAKQASVAVSAPRGRLYVHHMNAGRAVYIQLSYSMMVAIDVTTYTVQGTIRLKFHNEPLALHLDRERVVKVIRQKGRASPPHMDGSIVFARLRQCALPHNMLPWIPHIPNCISIGSAVFVGFMIVTDRQPDHATLSITIGRIYVHSTAMPPNNIVVISIPP